MTGRNENIIKRDPVVVVMGHIDHGKTSLLMAIRNFGTLEREVGGITQHIGAYQIEHQNKKITFIDTPGHEAFSAMRARGARVADIAVLVIAGDEGIKPQTKEALGVIKRAEISMIVAINKMDKPGADAERVKTELTKSGILLEGRGGNTPCVEVSAKTGKGISDVLDLILLMAEMENLVADISKKVTGVVIESYLDSKRGPIATVILSEGTLKTGDIIGSSSTFGKAKGLENFQKEPIEKALPSVPAIILGFKDVPGVGERFQVFPDTESAETSIKKTEEKTEIFFIEPDKKVLNLILKVDVLGSIEAIEEVLKNIPQEEIVLRIVKKEVGDVNLSDLKLAETSQALIVGFRVKTLPSIMDIAQQKKIRIANFELIYDLVEGIRNFMGRFLAPQIIRTDLGKLKTLVVFRSEKKRQIVGGRIIEGEIVKGKKIEILRDDEITGEGRIISLQKNKKDIDKGVKGDEVGILYEGETKINEGDILIIYEEKRQKVSL